MLHNLLIPLDESDLAELAVPYAKEIVSTHGTLTLLAVVDVPAYPYMLAPSAYPMTVESDRAEYDHMVENMTSRARDYLRNVADRLSGEGYHVNIRVNSGDPANSIIETAKELNSDAIVMSTHGRSGLSRWVFGSVTQKVLAATPCPVLVVPPSSDLPAPVSNVMVDEAAGEPS